MTLSGPGSRPTASQEIWLLLKAATAHSLEDICADISLGSEAKPAKHEQQKGVGI
jgi:hypothetical protein